MSKRTKGKWIAIHDHDKNFVEPEQETKHGDYIAYCSGQGRDIGIEEAAANCDFIAAAGTATDKIEQLGYAAQAAIEALPELLDVLQRIVQHLDADNDDSYRADDREGAMDTCYYIAKTAIDGIREQS